MTEMFSTVYKYRRMMHKYLRICYVGQLADTHNDALVVILPK